MLNMYLIHRSWLKSADLGSFARTTNDLFSFFFNLYLTLLDATIFLFLSPSVYSSSLTTIFSSIESFTLDFGCYCLYTSTPKATRYLVEVALTISNIPNIPTNEPIKRRSNLNYYALSPDYLPTSTLSPLLVSILRYCILSSKTP